MPSKSEPSAEKNRKVGDARPVTLATVKALLTKREKAGELHYEQKLALEYAKKFARLEQKDSEELCAELMKLEIPRFKERHAAKLADILPEDKSSVKAVFSKESITLNNDQTEEVLKLLAKYRKK